MISPNNISLRQLRAFRAVARAGSFVDAAESLHVTRSALSELIKQLETAVGARLFDRTTRRVALTPVGEQFLDQVQQVLRGLDDALQRIDDGLVGDGLVRVVGSPVALKSIVLPTLQRLRRQYPKVRVILIEAGGEEIFMAVRDGRADFGLGAIQPRQAEEVHSVTLCVDRLCVIASRTHPLMRRTAAGISIKALAGLPFIGLTTDTLIAQLLEECALAPESVRRPQIRVSNPLLLTSCIRLGLGVSVLMALAAHYLDEPGIACRLLTDPGFEREIRLLVRKERSLSPAARIVWEEILRNPDALAGIAGVQPAPAPAGHQPHTGGQRRNRPTRG